MQYSTSATFTNLILLSLAIFAAVVISTTAHVLSTVHSFSVADMLCLTTNLLLAGVVLRYDHMLLG